MYFIVIGKHSQPFCCQSSSLVHAHLGCVVGLGVSEGGALWGF